jgi:hypothetical protein
MPLIIRSLLAARRVPLTSGMAFMVMGVSVLPALLEEVEELEGFDRTSVDPFM